MKCDFCEFEDNVSKLNECNMPDGWLAVQVHKKYNVLRACPKCARILIICTFMANYNEANKAYDGDALKQFFPNLKRKDDIDE